MTKKNYLKAGLAFNAEVLALAVFADKMIFSEKEVEDGKKLMKYCKDIFKKGQAHINSMFKADNKTSYSELQFNDHFEYYKPRVRVSKDNEENLSMMKEIHLKLKGNAREMQPSRISFDSGMRWEPTTHDTKRHNSILKTIDGIEKMLS